jgi:hypothetical protein
VTATVTRTRIFLVDIEAIETVLVEKPDNAVGELLSVFLGAGNLAKQWLGDGAVVGEGPAAYGDVDQEVGVILLDVNSDLLQVVLVLYVYGHELIYFGLDEDEGVVEVR